MVSPCARRAVKRNDWPLSAVRMPSAQVLARPLGDLVAFMREALDAADQRAANWGGLLLLVVGLNLLLLLPFGRPFFFVRHPRPLSGHPYEGIVRCAARNDVRQLQTLARASPIVACLVRHSRRPVRPVDDKRINRPSVRISPLCR
jgi:hypothetical protein